MAKPKYEVTAAFKDAQDKLKKYKEGDRYPRPANKKIAPERIEELKTKTNRKGVPFIKELEPEAPEEQPGADKEQDEE